MATIFLNKELVGSKVGYEALIRHVHEITREAAPANEVDIVAIWCLLRELFLC